MKRKRTVLLALGVAASLFFAPLVVGSCQITSKLAQEDKTMMNGKSEGGFTDEACPCAMAFEKREYKDGDGKGSCGGEGLKDRCVLESLNKN